MKEWKINFRKIKIESGVRLAYKIHSMKSYTEENIISYVIQHHTLEQFKKTKQNSENYLPLWAMWLPVEFSKLNYTKDNRKGHFAAIGFKPVKNWELTARLLPLRSSIAKRARFLLKSFLVCDTKSSVLQTVNCSVFYSLIAIGLKGPLQAHFYPQMIPNLYNPFSLSKDPSSSLISSVWGNSSNSLLLLEKPCCYSPQKSAFMRTWKSGASICSKRS